MKFYSLFSNPERCIMKKDKNPKNIQNKIYQKSLDRESNFKEEEVKKLSKSFSENPEKRPDKKCPRCGRKASVKSANRSVTVTTKYGEVTYTRHQYYCEHCQLSFFPHDKKLGFDDEKITEDIQKFILDFAMNDTFTQSSKRMEFHHHLSVSASGIQNMLERATKALTEAVKPPRRLRLPLHDFNAHQPVVISNDGSMIQCRDGWHEVKLLSVRVHEESDAVYFAETLNNEDLEKQIRSTDGYERLRNRMVLWLADGAPYNWNVQERLCPHAKPLLDFMHLKQHLYECAKSALGEDEPLVELFVESAVMRIVRNDVKEVISELKECYMEMDNRSKAKRKAFSGLWNYLERNINRLNYEEFLANDWPIGSGEIESAHKHVLQKRMKQAGMRWSREGMQRMAKARALYASVEPSEFLELLKSAA